MHTLHHLLISNLFDCHLILDHPILYSPNCLLYRILLSLVCLDPMWSYPLLQLEVLVWKLFQQLDYVCTIQIAYLNLYICFFCKLFVLFLGCWCHQTQDIPIFSRKLGLSIRIFDQDEPSQLSNFPHISGHMVSKHWKPQLQIWAFLYHILKTIFCNLLGVQNMALL